MKKYFMEIHIYEVENCKIFFREHKNKRKIGKDKEIREEKCHLLNQVTRYFVYVCTIEYSIVRWKYIIIIIIITTCS